MAAKTRLNDAPDGAQRASPQHTISFTLPFSFLPVQQRPIPRRDIAHARARQTRPLRQPIDARRYTKDIVSTMAAPAHGVEASDAFPPLPSPPRRVRAAAHPIREPIFRRSSGCRHDIIPVISLPMRRQLILDTPRPRFHAHGLTRRSAYAFTG